MTNVLPHLLKILRVSMISLNAKKFSMRHVKQTLRPRAAGPALRSGGGGGAGGPACKPPSHPHQGVGIVEHRCPRSDT